MAPQRCRFSKRLQHAELPTNTSKRNAGRVCLIEKRGDIRCPMHIP